MKKASLFFGLFGMALILGAAGGSDTGAASVSQIDTLAVLGCMCLLVSAFVGKVKEF